MKKERLLLIHSLCAQARRLDADVLLTRLRVGSISNSINFFFMRLAALRVNHPLRSELQPVEHAPCYIYSSPLGILGFARSILRALT